MIKLCHLIWDNSPMAFLNACTVWSFKRWNPDWQVWLWHINIGFDKPWKTREHKENYLGKCYFSSVCKDVDKVAHLNPDDIRKGIQSSVHLSDILRIQLLHKYGGLYSDFDILYTAPLPFSLSKSVLFEMSKDCGKKTIYYLPVALFYSPTPNELIWKDILEIGKKRSNGKQYEKFGVEVFDILLNLRKILPLSALDISKRIQRKYPKFNFELLPGTTYLPVLPNFTNHLFNESGSKEFEELKNPKLPVFAIHWYNGHPAARSFLNKKEPDNSIMSKLSGDYVGKGLDSQLPKT